MSKSKVIHNISSSSPQQESEHGLLWTNPAYALSPEVDLVSTMEEAQAYVSRIY